MNFVFECLVQLLLVLVMIIGLVGFVDCYLVVGDCYFIFGWEILVCVSELVWV